jgi:hypothetical protein
VRDLTSQVTTLTYTNSADDVLICQGVVYLGDGVNDLDGSGGDFELTLQFGQQINQYDAQLVRFSTAVRASVFTEQFPLPVNESVTFKIKSPNATDTSVWTHATLYEVSDLSKMSSIGGMNNTIVNEYNEGTGGVNA